MKKILLITAVCACMAASAIAAEEPDTEQATEQSTELAVMEPCTETEQSTDLPAMTESCTDAEQETEQHDMGYCTDAEQETETAEACIRYECTEDGKGLSVYLGQECLAYFDMIGNYEFRESDPCNGYAYVLPVGSTDPSNTVGSIKALPEYSMYEAVDLYTGDQMLGEGHEVISEEEVISLSGENYILLAVNDNSEDTAYYAITSPYPGTDSIILETHGNYFVNTDSKEAALEVVSCVMNGINLSHGLIFPT